MIKNIWSCNIGSGWFSLHIMLFWKELCFKFLEDTLISFLFLGQKPSDQEQLRGRKSLFVLDFQFTVHHWGQSERWFRGDSKQERWKNAASGLTHFSNWLSLQTRASHLPRGDSTHRALLHQVTTKSIHHRHAHRQDSLRHPCQVSLGWICRISILGTKPQINRKRLSWEVSNSLG